MEIKTYNHMIEKLDLIFTDSNQKEIVEQLRSLNHIVQNRVIQLEVEL